MSYLEKKNHSQPTFPQFHETGSKGFSIMVNKSWIYAATNHCKLESQKTRKVPQHQFCRRSLSLLDQIRWSVLRVTFIDLHGWKTLDYCHHSDEGHSEDSNSSASVFQLKVSERKILQNLLEKWTQTMTDVFLCQFICWIWTQWISSWSVFSEMRKHSCSFLHSRQGLHLWLNHANITFYSNITRKKKYEIIFGVSIGRAIENVFFFSL